MIVICSGGLDVALAMAGETYSLKCSKVIKVNLIGNLGYMTSSKDIILEVLRKCTVKGGVGKVFMNGEKLIIDLGGNSTTQEFTEEIIKYL